MYDELVKDLREISGNRAIPVHMAETAKEAADAIEELSRLNAEITKRELKLRMEKPRWIPVTERLPENDVAVLVTYIGYNSHKLQADLLAYRYDGT